MIKGRFIVVGLCWLVLLFSACDGVEQDTTIKDYDVVIVNMGNYSESNGSLSLYNETTGEVQQEVYTRVNKRKLGGIIESVTWRDTLLLLMCNNADKVVFLHAETMKELCRPLTENVGIPRYAAVVGDYAYITCWQKVNKKTQVVDVSHQLMKVNLRTKQVEKSLAVTAQPEGIVYCEGELFVASGNGLDVFDTATDELLIHINSQFTGDAQQVVLDKNKRVWLSVGSYTPGQSGFMVVDAATKAIVQQLPEPKLTYEGDIALTMGRDSLLFLSSDGVVGGQSAEVPTAIYAVDVATYQTSAQVLVNGYGFYGLGVNPANGATYTANVNGFITNSSTYRYSSLGSKLSQFVTGVGACRFVFTPNP
jgi:hypothetical protein